MPDINIWAVLVAAASSFLLGGLWYSPMVFEKTWNRESGRPEAPRTRHPAIVFGLSFVLAVIAAFAFAWWLGPNPELTHALCMGLGVGAFWVATSFGINYLFAGRSLKLWLIDAGYHVLQFAIFGLVLGLWH